MNISIDLLKKYNVQGPRYTSYPPAPSWSDKIGPAQYEQILVESNKSKAPLSLYVHLPFCEKLCYFCGCTTLITGKNRSFEGPYLKALEKEIEWLAMRLDRSRPVRQMHFGGGTPTYSSPDDLRDLTILLKKHFAFEAGAEIGIEVDPRVTTLDHLTTLRGVGFNRISMGVQDFAGDVQVAVNRVQPYGLTKKLVEDARALGFESVNIDLIYGLPHQTPASFSTTIDQILTIDPDRLAVYSYAHVPWLKQHQDLFQEFLPGEQQKFEIFLTALKKFTAAGYEYIGMDHFAKPADELTLARNNRSLWRNFMGYTTKAGTDLIGLGMSAISSVHGAFAQNKREVKTYEESIDAGTSATFRGFQLSTDDKVRARVIQNLLCHAVVIKKEIESEFKISFDPYFDAALKGLQEPARDGLVELKKDEIRPTELGRIFLRNLAMPFDAYLPKPGEKRLFSRTV